MDTMKDRIRRASESYRKSSVPPKEAVKSGAQQAVTAKLAEALKAGKAQGSK